MLARTAVRVQQTRRVPILGQTALHFLQVRFELLAQNSGDASTIVALMQQPGGTFASELTAQLKMLWPQFAMSYRPIANGAGGKSPDVVMQAAAVGLPEQVVQQKVRWAKLAEQKRGKLAAAKAATTHVVPDDKHQKVTQVRCSATIQNRAPVAAYFGGCTCWCCVMLNVAIQLLLQRVASITANANLTSQLPVQL